MPAVRTMESRDPWDGRIMSALARWCYQHRLVVIAIWIGLLIGLAGMSQAIKTAYDNSFTLPATGSGSAQELLQRSAPDQAGDTDTIAWHVTHGTVRDPAVEARMSAVLARVSRVPEVAVVASPYTAGGLGGVDHLVDVGLVQVARGLGEVHRGVSRAPVPAYLASAARRVRAGDYGYLGHPRHARQHR